LIEIVCKESANFKPVWDLIFTKLTRKKINFKPDFRRDTKNDLRKFDAQAGIDPTNLYKTIAGKRRPAPKLSQNYSIY